MISVDLEPRSRSLDDLVSPRMHVLPLISKTIYARNLKLGSKVVCGETFKKHRNSIDLGPRSRSLDDLVSPRMHVLSIISKTAYARNLKLWSKVVCGETFKST